MSQAPISRLEDLGSGLSPPVAPVPGPRHYGDPSAEYRAVREAVGVCDRSDQARLRMWGKDPAKMLHGLITNDLVGAPPNRGVYAAMLTPKGRMIADLRVLALARPEGAELLIDLPREALTGVTAHLAKFVPPMFARWEDVSPRLALIGVYGPHARSLLGRLTFGTPGILDLPEDGFVALELAGTSVVAIATRYAGGEDGYDLVVAREARESVWMALLNEGLDLGARAVGLAALDTLRIEAGQPRYGYELTEEIIPTEAFESTGLMARAISFTKGCYTGQEVIVRIAHRGHVNRQLRGLRMGPVPPPVRRTPLFGADSSKEVGWTTSATLSPLLRETIALGYVRREFQPGDTVRLGSSDGPEIRLSALPFSATPADADE